MTPDLREYARLGLTHHLLHASSMGDPDEHVETLLAFIRRGDIETLDCCVPYGDAHRARLLPALRACGKDIVYALHLFPLRKISLGSLSPAEQAQTRMIVADQVDMAAASGASGLVLGSGVDVPEAQRPAARRAFAEFLRWLCAALKPHRVTVLLEPFDRDFDKKFLYGPTRECVELIESLRPEVDNFGIELDVAHLPLMGETFRDAFHTAAPHLKRVHLGNCVMRDRANPWYGDQHPPIGLPGGEIDIPELCEILRSALDVGYLDPARRGALVLEMQPFPGRSAEDTVRDNLGRLEQAWRRL